MIAYRVQQPEHSLDLLLDPETQLSTNWADEDDVRNGVSACASVEELAIYLAQSGIPFDADCLLVAMECEWADDEDADAALGAILVIPTAIISATCLDDDFFALVNAAA